MAIEYPEDLNYIDSHEYVRFDGKIATVGISAFALDQLGDVVFLELPEVGDVVEIEEAFGTVESVKAVSDLYPPVSGTIVDRNEAAIDAPEILSEDPYGEGWLVKVKVDDPDDELSNTMSAQEYRALVEGMDQ
ncbi:MAG: glycine cleavage system protein GcvH [Cyanobacteria bacterium J06621_8]